jgi:hypothetical protein
VRFVWPKVLNVKDIHKEIFPVYCGNSLSRKAVHNWVEKFSQGRPKVADDTRPGRPVAIATDATVQRVGEFIRADRKIMTDSVATALGCSHGLAYSIMHDHLKFRKVCARWVPRELKDREMGLSLQRLLRYADEGEDMLNRTVTGERVHHYQPESKRASVQWKLPSSPSTKKFKVTLSAGKVILTVFCDSHGVLLAHFQKRVENVNSASYCEVLLKLRDSIRRKRPCRQNSRIPVGTSYSTDFAAVDFHPFGPLKNHLRGRRFADDEKVKTEVRKWLR